MRRPERKFPLCRKKSLPTTDLQIVLVRNTLWYGNRSQLIFLRVQNIFLFPFRSDFFTCELNILYEELVPDSKQRYIYPKQHLSQFFVLLGFSYE